MTSKRGKNHKGVTRDDLIKELVDTAPTPEENRAKRRARMDKIKNAPQSKRSKKDRAAEREFYKEHPEFNPKKPWKKEKAKKVNHKPLDNFVKANAKPQTN